MAERPKGYGLTAELEAKVVIESYNFVHVAKAVLRKKTKFIHQMYICIRMYVYIYIYICLL